MAKRKSWREKLADNKDLPKVDEMPERLRERWAQARWPFPRRRKWTR